MITKQSKPPHPPPPVPAPTPPVAPTPTAPTAPTPTAPTAPTPKAPTPTAPSTSTNNKSMTKTAIPTAPTSVPAPPGNPTPAAGASSGRTTKQSTFASFVQRDREEEVTPFNEEISACKPEESGKQRDQTFEIPDCAEAETQKIPQHYSAEKEEGTKRSVNQEVKEKSTGKKDKAELGSKIGKVHNKPSSKRTKLAQKKSKRKRKLLDNGSVISSPKHKYVIIGLLGSGGFGDVYKVQRPNDPAYYAMKTEANDLEDRLRRLKIEAETMEECMRLAKSPNILPLVDKGHNKFFKFIVMPVVWLSLDKIRIDFLGKQYTENTAKKICVQMVEALRDLHAMGFLHRDLKPANFAPGLSGNDRKVVYLLDFGVVRRYVDNKGAIIPPRAKVAFMGTLRYAPRAGIRHQEQARKDDLESLCYVMCDIYFDSILPWRGMVDKKALLQLKENFMFQRGPTTAELFKMFPPEFERIVKYTSGLRFESTPDYTYIVDELRKQVDMAKPLDWEVPSNQQNTGTGTGTTSTSTGQNQPQSPALGASLLKISSKRQQSSAKLKAILISQPGKK